MMDKNENETSPSQDKCDKKSFNKRKFRKLIAEVFPSEYSKERARRRGSKKRRISESSSENVGSSDEEHDTVQDTNQDTSKQERSMSPNKTTSKVFKGRRINLVLVSSKNNSPKTPKDATNASNDDKVQRHKKDTQISTSSDSDFCNSSSDDPPSNSDDELSFSSDSNSSSDETYKSETSKQSNKSNVDIDETCQNEILRQSPPLRRSKRLFKKRLDQFNAGDNKEDSIKNISQQFEKVTRDQPLALQDKFREKWSKFCKEIASEKKTYEKAKEKKAKSQKKKNTILFKSLIKQDPPKNDYKYFYNFLNIDEQKQLLAEAKKVSTDLTVKTPYRFRILELDTTPEIKSVALTKVSMWKKLEKGDNEYVKMLKWIDGFMNIPFGKYSKLDISLSSGQSICHEYMEKCKKSMDEVVYGLNDAKLQIMQMVGQWVSNPDAIGNAIAIHGPMGTGKTTLVKDSISKVLGRDFAFIALGGAKDSSYLEGHSYTYEGATWGKIVDLLMKCKTINPIFYFDELDKVSDSPKGEEIIGILTHLIDTSQNSKYCDRYFSDIEFDLSRCLFIFSYNDPDKVNPILRDRMYTIKTNGYSIEDKIQISKLHLIPNLLPQCGFSMNDIIFSDDILRYIVTNLNLDLKEKGVRCLKRTLELLITRINLHRLLKPGTDVYGHTSKKLDFPLYLTPELAKEIIGDMKRESDIPWTMYS